MFFLQVFLIEVFLIEVFLIEVLARCRGSPVQSVLLHSPTIELIY